MNYPDKVFFSVIAATLLVAAVAVAKTDNERDDSKLLHEPHIAVCHPRDGDVRCHVRVITESDRSTPKTTSLPNGFGPTQFHVAYSVPTTSATKNIIAIVDAYDDPNIYSDLATYSKTYAIPVLPQCAGPIAASASPCFQKVNQFGQTFNYPSVNSGWALEISLDVEVAHAMCQNCGILLVEASSNSYANLMAAVDRAVTLGANEVSNSYGSAEFSGETGYDAHFNHSGIVFTFSSGDAGYGVEYPAASQYVVAVGGTTLFLNSDNSYNSETAWSGSGSGCSQYESKPTWQSDASCTHRAIADVSAVADPNTGAAVYDSVRYQGKSGWFKVGGTSLSSPLIAAVYGLQGTVGSSSPASLPYALGNSANMHDITSGSNGSCAGTYLCTALTGYDGPTGLGTPLGTSAF
ncbi:MAG: S53 family peptidase [Candidatus Sungbacteria bacterium]|uniref:S53 family peptidase n=1 Tax=Candidatus Sungiibacteriota bacterium TaxID=2750080 RepID=A0A9D6LUK6_9BACT|nr:S53 family peptidase [Candidatus Sungbacteria bacterium]